MVICLQVEEEVQMQEEMEEGGLLFEDVQLSDAKAKAAATLAAVSAINEAQTALLLSLQANDFIQTQIESDHSEDQVIPPTSCSSWHLENHRYHLRRRVLALPSPFTSLN